MTERPVFVPENVAPFYAAKNVKFEYYSGFWKGQNRKSINSLHKAFHNRNPEKKILEISSVSEDVLGVKLSAFNLTFIDGVYRNISVECAYQGGKIFEYGGPYLDLLSKTSKEAKKDPRLSQSGNVIGFRLNDKNYIQKNIEVFYSYLYISALKQNIELAEGILKFDAFTDIFYNPKKSVSCQARSAAMFVGMSMAGITDIEKVLPL